MPVGVDEVHRQAERREVPAQQIMGATIEAALCQQVIPRRQHGEERGGDRRHAARGDQRGLRALQRRELGMQRELARGVVGAQVAHVVVAAFTAVLIGRGLEDRHLHRARDSRQRLAGVYQLGFDTHGGFRHWSLRKCDCHSNTLPCPHAFMERRAPAPRLALCRRAASTAARAGKSLRVRRPTERFSSRVEHYVRYRPSYPRAAIDLLKTRCGLSPAAEYAQIAASRADEASMRRFFGGAMELAVFPNWQSFDFEGLKGRLMSSSYAPEPGHPQHEPMMADLRELFGRHEHRGQVLFPYRTLVYFGQPQRPVG